MKLFRIHYLLLYIVLVLSSLNSLAQTTPLGDDWISMGKDSNDKLIMYINRSSLKFKNGEIAITFRSEYKAENKTPQGLSYNYIVTNRLIDCKNDSSLLLKVEYFNKANKIVNEDFVSKEFAKWDKISPKSFLSMASEKYCPEALRQPSPSEKGKQTDPDPKKSQAYEKCKALGFISESAPFERCVSQLTN